MIDEEKVYEEFEKALLEALEQYEGVKDKDYQAINIFIEDRVWDALVKYTRMEITTKEKFFENIYKQTDVKEYIRGLLELWENVDHTYMDEAIKELRLMVLQKDFNDAIMYGNKKITTRSIKLENYWREFELKDDDFYPLNPGRDFTMLERRYINRHIKLYEDILKRYQDSDNRARDIAKFVKEYDRLDRTIPYFSHTTGEIIRYVDIATYNSMLFNVNLLRSAWNRAIYDAKLLGNHLWYLEAHPFACPHCMKYQGYVYTDHEPTSREINILRQYGNPMDTPNSWQKETAIEGDNGVGIGHPNCKHPWLSFWSEQQIQDEKYNSQEWEEKYKTQQKIQSLDLKKSRLLADRRIYKELGQQDLVDKTTEQIKRIREKKKELENM